MHMQRHCGRMRVREGVCGDVCSHRGRSGCGGGGRGCRRGHGRRVKGRRRRVRIDDALTLAPANTAASAPILRVHARCTHDWRTAAASESAGWLRCCGCAGQRRRTPALHCTRPPTPSTAEENEASARTCACGCDAQSAGCLMAAAASVRLCVCADRCGVEWLDPPDRDSGGAAAAAASASSGAVSQRSISQCRPLRTRMQPARQSDRRQQLQQTVSVLVEWTKGRTARRSSRSERHDATSRCLFGPSLSNGQSIMPQVQWTVNTSQAI